MKQERVIIKDSSLVVESESSPDGKDIQYTLARTSSRETSVKLSDVFNYIPSGHVIKSETGMGATTLELKAQRNSIIVEPIRVTASAKAHKHEGSLYVGSPTNLHKKVTDETIVAYCNNERIKYKKILVVADSLPRLIKVVGDKLFQDYFLMIDEIDSFQTDASFRSKMENCIDVYKRFDTGNRAIVSATAIDFSDPKLKEESKTFIQYDNAIPREILSFCTTDIKAIAAEVIQERLEEYPANKIMVAYNSVAGCRAIADKLVALNAVQKGDIKILCSSNNQHEVQGYYSNLEDDRLPAKVCFFTSAYFSGFDLHEDYHLVSVSGNRSMFHALSEKRLKQIAGRCRQKLLSETIVYDNASFFGLPRKYNTLEDLMKAAENEISALKCIDKHFSSNPLLKDNLDSVRDYIIKQTAKEGHQYVRKPLYGDARYAPSYLSIDAYLESVRVRKTLYNEQNQLPSRLEDEGNIVSDFWAEPDIEVVEQDTTKLIRQEMVEQVITIIKRGSRSIEEFLKLRSTTPLQRLIIKGYTDNQAYIDNTQLLSLIEEKAAQRDARGLKNLMTSAYYACMNEKQLYKRNVKANLPLEVAFTKQQLLSRWKVIFMESGLHYSMASLVAAVRLTKTHFKVKQNRKDKTFTLKGENPLNLRLTGERSQSNGSNDPLSIYEAFTT